MSNAMNPKHTPGPWAVAPSISGQRYYVYSVKGFPGHHCIVEGPNYGIADVAGETEQECRANAHLIALAPELEEALRECITEPGSAGMQDGLGRMRRRLLAINDTARAVLAKLDGRTE